MGKQVALLSALCPEHLEVSMSLPRSDSRLLVLSAAFLVSLAACGSGTGDGTGAGGSPGTGGSATGGTTGSGGDRNRRQRAVDRRQ